MAAQLQSLAIQAPGFFGLNSQDSPTDLTEQFALEATNCVVDQFGRIGARKGWKYVTTSATDSIVHMSEFVKTDGTSEVISASDSNIYKGTTTLTDITPASYTVDDGLFSACSLNGFHFLFRKGSDPVYYDGTTCDEVSAHVNYDGTIPLADTALSGFGRLWVGNTDTNNHTVYWSDLLNGFDWDNGSSGSIDVSKVWPDGTDEIVALASHNNLLFIFGKRQILIYQGAEDPATMSLADTIVGVGCVSRDSVQPTGTDLLFLSEDGVRSINRTIQEKSAPMRDISKNVRTELTSLVAVETNKDQIFSVYNAEEAFYLLHLPDNGSTYVFDMRAPLQDGAHRVTIWKEIQPQALLTLGDGTLYLGKADGVAEYDGFQDNGAAYQMSYFTNYFDFGAPNSLKLLKNLKFSVIGGSGTQATLNWGYDYSYSYKKRTFTLQEQLFAEYNIAEYNEGEFNAGVLVNRPSVSASGGGSVVQIGIEADINGSSVSIQRISAQAVIGRTI